MKVSLPIPQIRSAIAYDLVGRNALRVQRIRDERAMASHTPNADSPMNAAPRSLANVKELMSAN